jgi:hypothetical protein
VTDAEPVPAPPSDSGAVDLGLTLWELQAEATEPGKASWVNRRVEQLEFLDTRAVRWRTSVDFVVPGTAPPIRLGTHDYWLVPVTTFPKRNLVAFDLRDEYAAAMCLPTLPETSGRLAPAVIWAATVLLAPRPLPPGLAADMEHIIASEPADHERQYAPFAAAGASLDVRRCQRRLDEVSRRRPGADLRIPLGARWRWARDWADAQDALTAAQQDLLLARRGLAGLEQCPECAARDLDDPGWARPELVDPGECRRCAAYQLMSDTDFRREMEELAANFVVHVAVPSPPGSRMIVKWCSEQPISFWTHRGLLRRLGQSLGLRCWPVDVFIGGRGGIHHLEVAAPPGVDIVQILAEPAVATDAGPGPVRSRGLSPHVHLRVPATPARYRATILVRTSRQGWLTASWLVAALIAVIMGFGQADLPVLFPPGAASGEAGTAATLLLALVGVIATWLVRPGEHPLASRLLEAVRILMLADVAAVLVGTGDLVLHRATRPLPVDLWLVLFWVTCVVAGFVTLARVFPVAAPERWGNRGWPGKLGHRRGGAR